VSRSVPSFSRRGYFMLSLGVLVLDQSTKLAAESALAPRGLVEVIPGFFNLSYSLNRGGLFGYFSDLPGPWRALLLTVIPLLAIGMIGWFLARGAEDERKTLLGLSLILGGAVGNLIDRVFRGEVVDFLDVYIASSGIAKKLVDWFGTAHWPTFNIADSAIVTGACLLVLAMLIPQSSSARERGDASPAVG
jgi:signal peptidase II